MSQYLDSSVLVASLTPDDPNYAACDSLLNETGNWISPHALNETFATLTGGRLGMRVDPDTAAKMIRESIVPCVSFVELSVEEILAGPGLSPAARRARWRSLRLHAFDFGTQDGGEDSLHDQPQRLPLLAPRRGPRGSLPVKR